MGDISPVLEAYLRGQQQQTSIIQQARDIANQQAEREQRQQTINEVVKQHGVENKRDQARLDLEQQMYQLNFRKEQEAVTDKFRESLKNETTPIQMATPGIESPTIPQGPGVQFPIPGVSLPPVPATSQTMQSPMGPITVPT